MMLKTIAALLAFMLPVVAQAYDLQAMQQQIMNDPQVQQAVGQQVMKQAAANPTGALGALGGATAGANTSNLNTLLAAVLASKTGAVAPAGATGAANQNAQLIQAAQAVMAKVFTPAERKSLAAYQATPTGASVMNKMPLLIEQMTPILVQMYGQK